MGMDLVGQNTTAEEGQYFRANVWHWHPLANYLCVIAPQIMDKVEYLHTNDGDGLDAADSVALADVLDAEIAAGNTEAYITAREAALAALPDEVCELCGGTGVRTDDIAKEHNFVGCNGCENTGKQRPWECNYCMDLDHIKEFAVFVRHSGGFQIF